MEKYIINITIKDFIPQIERKLVIGNITYKRFADIIKIVFSQSASTISYFFMNNTKRIITNDSNIYDEKKKTNKIVNSRALKYPQYFKLNNVSVGQDLKKYQTIYFYQKGLTDWMYRITLEKIINEEKNNNYLISFTCNNPDFSIDICHNNYQFAIKPLVNTYEMKIVNFQIQSLFGVRK